MKIARIGIAGLLAALTLNVWAAGSPPPGAGKSKIDATGTWTAKMEGRGGGPGTTIVLVLKQDKKELTGTMSTNGGPPIEIKDGRALRTTIYFEVEMTMPAMPAMPGRQGMGPPPGQQPGAPMKMVTKYEASIDGDTMIIEPKMGGMGGGMPMGGGGMGGGGMGGGGMGGPPPGGMGGGMGGPPPGGGMGGMMGGMGKITATRQK